MADNERLFHAAHYNAIAKEIRELFPMYDDGHGSDNKLKIAQRTVLVHLSLNLCKRFLADNAQFDPMKFLFQCSPDNNIFPLTELYSD